jgi:hypothetical protein
MTLTAEQVTKYRYDGYLYPVPALSPDEVAEYNADLARYEEWLGKPVNQGDWRWRSAAYVFLPWLDRLVRHPSILDAVESLIGPDILVFTSTFFIKEANSPTFAAWHQDATYFGIDAAACSCRVKTSPILEPCSDCTTSRFSSPGTPKIRSTPSFSRAVTSRSDPLFIRTPPQTDPWMWCLGARWTTRSARFTTIDRDLADFTPAGPDPSPDRR